MAKYRVFFNALASASYIVEADSPEEACKLAEEMRSRSDAEFSEWDYDNPGEVVSEDTDEYFDINDLEIEDD